MFKDTRVRKKSIAIIDKLLLRRLPVNPILAIVITGIVAFTLHILFVIAFRSKN